MPTVNQDIEVRLKGDQILDQVTKKLGIFNKEGLAMGVAFAGVNIAIGLAQSAITGFMDYIQKGVEMNREFEMSLARVANTMDSFSQTSMPAVREELLTMSVAFAENVNTLASGLQRFIREGASTTEGLHELAAAEKLNIITNEGLESSSDALVTSMEVFNLTSGHAGYIAENLNKIWSKTGLSMNDIANIMGRSAGQIRENGLSMDDLVAALYELEQQGYKGISMTTALRDALEDYKKIQKLVTDGQKAMNDAIGDIPDISSKLEKVMGTKALIAEQMKQLGAISQIDLGGWTDLGSLFDQQMITDAQKYFDLLQKQGITTLKAFNEASGKKALQGLNPDFGLIGIPKDLQRLIQSFYYLNDHIIETGDSIDDLDSLIAENRKKFDDASEAIAEYSTQLSDIRAERTRLTAMHEITIEQHYMELGMLSAAYANKIQNAEARNLINTLRQQQTEIDKLTRKNDEYSMQSTANTIEEMKIQLQSLDHRGRMTREQRQRMKELERASLELRIKETENQLAIDKITYDMTPEQQHLEMIKAIMGEELFIIQDTYNREIQALKDKQAAIQLLLEEQQQIQSTAQTFLNQNTPPVYSFGNRGPGWRGGRQSGGPIFETGLYTLHKGEYVVPKSGTTAGTPSKTNVNIKIDLTVKNQDNAERLAMRIGELIAQGYLKGVDCVYHLGG
jgi:hypothetical protein